LIAHRSTQKTGGKTVIDTALALHIHISTVEGNLAFQATQCTPPKREAEIIWKPMTNGRFSGSSLTGIAQNEGTESEVGDIGSKFRYFPNTIALRRCPTCNAR
jgi:hypothetical protein